MNAKHRFQFSFLKYTTYIMHIPQRWWMWNKHKIFSSHKKNHFLSSQTNYGVSVDWIWRNLIILSQYRILFVYYRYIFHKNANSTDLNGFFTQPLVWRFRYVDGAACAFITYLIDRIYFVRDIARLTAASQSAPAWPFKCCQNLNGVLAFEMLQECT